MAQRAESTTATSTTTTTTTTTKKKWKKKKKKLVDALSPVNHKGLHQDCDEHGSCTAPFPSVPGFC